MAKFNIDDYVPVQDRIHQFWHDYPNGRIVVRMLSDPNIFERVVMEAAVYQHRDNPFPDAVDIAAEEAGKGGMANATSWHENCATSAIGRALADLGYATSQASRPSREEMTKVERTTPRGQNQSESPAPTGEVLMVTEKQLKMIGGLAEEIGLSWDEVKAMHGKPSARELTRVEASQLIDRLQTMRDQRGG